ncbi:hypothetical protein [Candidatus Nanohalobium constans]|uniref:DUF4157 domain-containing protein n=1 Tax=Candidatus Nanohalobium constans TaxID=2565781 RepID=A0A5Q0UFW7_9ARCH|nr:hypothetical protein [Candidatus Nanohalobium constans]QGA80444.1 hypothetical protein LC1Nh_0546 [Candidatus Nanohalobium constans]
MKVQTQDPREEELRERVREVAEKYGLEIENELDDVGVKYLGTYVNAQTSLEGPKLRIDFDSHNFFKQSEKRQRRIILHELIHVKQFNNSLSDWAENEFDVSDEVAEKLDGTIWEDVRSVEGETELLLSSFFPEQDSSYPYAQSSKEREFDGIDLDSEFDSNTEDELDDIIDEYKLKEDSWDEDGLYIEEGEFKGVEYSVAVIGSYESPEEKVDEYLTRVQEPDYGIQEDSSDYSPGALGMI